MNFVSFNISKYLIVHLIYMILFPGLHNIFFIEKGDEIKTKKSCLAARKRTQTAIA